MTTELNIIGAVGWVEKPIGGKVLTFPGGAGLNIAIAAKRGGLNVSIISVIGADAPALDDDGLTDLCCVYKGETARFLYKAVEDGSEPTINCHYGVLDEVTDYVCLLSEPYAGKWNHVCCRAPIDPGRVLPHILQREPELMSLDFIYASLPKMLEASAPYLSSVDYVFMNEAELDLAKETRQLDGFTGHLIVTRGDAGAYIAKEGRRVAEVSGRKVSKVLDTSGAGDTFAGTLIAKIALGGSLDEALEAANDEASRIVERVGVGV